MFYKVRSNFTLQHMILKLYVQVSCLDEHLKIKYDGVPKGLRNSVDIHYIVSFSSISLLSLYGLRETLLIYFPTEKHKYIFESIIIYIMI